MHIHYPPSRQPIRLVKQHIIKRPSGRFSHHMEIKTNNDLLKYITERAENGEKQWFGRLQQRTAGVNLAYEIARNHADKMTPEQIAQYVVDLNNQIFKKIVVG